MDRTSYYSQITAGNSAVTLAETMKLHETIKLQIEASNKQSDLIKKLTIFMAVLAVIQTFATIAQLAPLFKEDKSLVVSGRLLETSKELSASTNKLSQTTQQSIDLNKQLIDTVVKLHMKEQGQVSATPKPNPSGRTSP